MVGAKHCETNENETAPGTVFLSKMHLSYQKKGWNTHFSQPLKFSVTDISHKLADYRSPGCALPVASELCSGIAISALGPRYENNLMTQQRRMMSTRAVNANRGTIEGIITTLNDKFNADIVNDTQAIYQFNVLSGDRREIFHIDLRNGSGSAGKGKSEGCPDTIFSIDAENFNRLIQGNLKAPAAYMTGRMKISGSMQKAVKLEKLFVTLLEK
nr:hydroxysteroid dehydrogenase-like protein 2 [Halyomorpha halys]